MSQCPATHVTVALFALLLLASGTQARSGNVESNRLRKGWGGVGVGRRHWEGGEFLVCFVFGWFVALLVWFGLLDGLLVGWCCVCVWGGGCLFCFVLFFFLGGGSGVLGKGRGVGYCYRITTSAVIKIAAVTTARGWDENRSLIYSIVVRIITDWKWQRAKGNPSA